MAWDDSNTTDYAYAFDGGQVWTIKRGEFPNMRDRRNVAPPGSSRSGLMLFGS